MAVSRYIIHGAGGVGASIGAQLHRSGKETLLIARGRHLEAIQRHGLDYRTPEGAERLHIPAVAHPDGIEFAPGDVAILAMKTQDSLPAIEALSAASSLELPVVCAQNGVHNERLAQRRFRHVLGLAVWIPAAFVEPGVVLNYAPHAPIDAGRVPSGVDDLTVEVVADLSQAGFDVVVRKDVLAWKYAKLITNAVATLDAVCGGRAGLEDLCTRIREEGEACYRAAGIEIPSDEAHRKRMGAAARAMGEIDGSSRTRGSSAQSLQRGLGSIETDYINGEIVWLGRKHGVATPVNESIQLAANELAAHAGSAPLSPDELRSRVAAAESLS
ncbi:MAG: ketopantoate reductase family protein [Deltaproteobacteria bacterium]|nr:ketopantoate reductase family protein [Deltaproteobacteria bacterium]